MSHQITKSKSFFEFIGLASLALFALLALPVGTGDTTELIKGSSQFFNCLTSQESGVCVELERFGFTPHLISAILLNIYPNADVVIVLWSLLNFISFIALLLLLRNFYYRNETPLAFSNIFFVGSIFTPIIAYSVYSFSESVFILISIFYFLILSQRKYYLASFVAIFAVAYKDNSFLTLVPLSLAILMINQEKIKTYFLSATGLVVGLLLNLFFNFLRFNAFENQTYQEGNIIINLPFNISNFFGVWLSPSGGALGYFFILPVILVLFFLSKFKEFNRIDRIISSIIFLSLLLTTLNLAIWFSPFGWIAWGPRLLLPSLILFIFVGFIFLNSRKMYFSNNWRTLKHIGYMLTAYLSFLSAAGFLINPGIWFKWNEHLVSKGILCSEIPSWNTDSVGALSCNLKLTWTYESLPIFSINEVFKNWNNSVIITFFILLIAIYFISKSVENIKSTKN